MPPAIGAALNIRPAGSADLDAMVRLLGELFAQEKEFRPDAVVQRRGLDAVLSGTHAGRLMVAEVERKVVGMVSLLYVPSTALGTQVALLEDMVVSAGHRGSGIGRSLLHAAVARAQADGCARITLLSDDDNPRAHAFYEEAGFRRSAMVPFRLLLTL